MTHSKFDVLIIGGGITGAGIAMDASSRGLETALVEMQDFAAGTSSRSTKLVHGGLRYLKKLEIKLVSQVGKERAIVYENGPHVTVPEWMLLPIQKGGTFGRLSTSLGLRMYDMLARVNKEERRRMLSVSETLKKEPLLKSDGLKGSGFYVEYRTDDARLTVEVIKAAVQYGTKAVNYSKVEQLLYENGKVVGAKVRDTLSDLIYSIYATKVINATGPWIDTIREQDRSKSGKELRLSKGVHLVIDKSRFPLSHAVYFDTPDGRMVFAIPRGEKAYVGTTDTFYNGNITSPRMTEDDIEYITGAVNDMFPEVKLTPHDVESSWAGLRPLILEEGKDPSEISRKDEIWQSHSGLITIAGGKLTGYRKMAETVVDLVVKVRKKEVGNRMKIPHCKTKQLPISGGNVGGSKGYPAFVQNKLKQAKKHGFTEKEGEWLIHLYGSNIDTVFSLKEVYEKEYKFQLPLYLYYSLLYSIFFEMTLKPEDYFVRRTGALFFDINWVKKWKKGVINCMAHYLNWTSAEKELHLQELEDAIVAAESTILADS
ncbi:glycerol-3-phosphate dehydrogenase/oxidase [Evansella sp. AB-rgal1]|uniref:glycerol-3-phosphate dehydrogenase/oxidase n=1 Tax=Evansella sp. AB-rgal1 TaxID=3242696 RepID=UPI00359E1186